MAAPITNVAPFNPPKITLDAPNTTRPTEGTESFTNKLRGILQDMNAVPKNGEQVSEAYAQGKQNDIHGTMISMAQADISLRLISNIRSRVVEAYREVMRMGA
jgi:flagellar hook-basal body complex protein FliE